MKVGIEGPCSAGKTTLIRTLVYTFPQVYIEIPEYVEYVNGAQHFPPFPPKTRDEALHTFQFFLKLECQRQADWRQKRRPSISALFDRTIFTLLAFEFAAREIHGIDILEHVTNLILENRDWLPERLFILQIPPEHIIQRSQKIYTKRDKMLIDPVFNQTFQSYFLEIEKTFGISVQQLDALQTPDNIAQIVHSLLHKI